MDKNYKIYNRDAEDAGSFIKPQSVDLVVTSPPYDDLRKYNGVGNTWNKDKFKSVALAMWDVLKPGGVVVWVVNDKVENGGKTGTAFEQALYFRDIGFKINDVMIWQKKNPMPQVRQPRYNQVFEYMFVLSKGKKQRLEEKVNATAD